MAFLVHFLINLTPPLRTSPSSFPSDLRGSDCLCSQCTSGPFVHVVCNFPSATDLWPHHHRSLKSGICLFLWISWLVVSAFMYHASFKAPTSKPIAHPCECVCVHANSQWNGLCVWVCVMWSKHTASRLHIAAFDVTRRFYFAFFLFIKVMSKMFVVSLITHTRAVHDYPVCTSPGYSTVTCHNVTSVWDVWNR